MITKDDIKNFTFQDYRKTVKTSISDEIIPAGTTVQTTEGDYVCQEPSRLAIDANNNVYPIAVSVFKKSFELAE